ncbi:MAG: complex I subunit 1 family protein [Phycisphaeraceae bacterium]
MSPQFFVSIVTIAIILHAILLACAYLIFLERKVAAWTQDRIGPNRTNFSFGLYDIWNRIPGLRWFMTKKHWGLGQALADGLKLFLKEDYTPPHVDRVLFILAPAIVVVPAIIGWAVMPWGGTYIFPGLTIPFIGLEIPTGVVTIAAAPINLALVYILAVSSLAVYGVVLAGYASNNKYSFLGGLRATAQMLSYEIPMGLCVLIVVLTFAATDADLLVNLQGGAGAAGAWGLFLHPLLAIIFFVAILAETNRAPFDLAEAEQELVGGFHTEYGSMKWALFFLAEYMHMITACAFFSIMFLGGWDLIPFVGEFPLVAESFLVVLAKAGILIAKVTVLLFVMMWIRWTLPRLRFDQLMGLAWRGLIPICIALLLATSLVIYMDWPRWTLPIANVLVGLVAMFVGPMLPKSAPNRRVRLEGSRFYAPQDDGEALRGRELDTAGAP